MGRIKLSWLGLGAVRAPSLLSWAQEGVRKGAEVGAFSLGVLLRGYCRRNCPLPASEVKWRQTRAVWSQEPFRTSPAGILGPLLGVRGPAPAPLL